MSGINPIIISALPLLFSFGAMSFNAHASESRLRAYVTNFEGEKASVIDLPDQKEITQITTGHKPHGVAVAPDGSEVFVTNEGDGTLSFIGSKGNKATETIKVGCHPQQFAVSQDGTAFYVPLNGDHAVAIVDTKQRKVVSTLPSIPGAILHKGKRTKVTGEV